MKLYGAARSSAAFRVRIALNLKGLAYEAAPVSLRENEQSLPEFLNLNPAGLVPVLVHDGRVLTQSLAIIEYLEDLQPVPPLLPADAIDRAYVRSLALAIACDVHPLNNLRVLRYLVHELKVDEESKNAWYRHWVESGLQQLEAQLVANGRSGRFCLGDCITLADVVLVPQIFNARRYHCRVDALPTVMKIFDMCMATTAFIDAQPARQMDFT